MTFLLKQDDAKMASQAGYTLPVSLSTDVKAMVEKAVADPDWCNDWNGVLWDILQMSTSPLFKQMDTDPTAVRFSVIITGLNGLKPGELDIEAHTVSLVSICGPVAIGDGSGCIAIMTSEEYEARRPFEYFRRIGYFNRLERSMN